MYYNLEMYFSVFFGQIFMQLSSLRLQNSLQQQLFSFFLYYSCLICRGDSTIGMRVVGLMSPRGGLWGGEPWSEMGGLRAVGGGRWWLLLCFVSAAAAASTADWCLSISISAARAAAIWAVWAARSMAICMLAPLRSGGVWEGGAPPGVPGGGGPAEVVTDGVVGVDVDVNS